MISADAAFQAAANAAAVAFAREPPYLQYRVNLAIRRIASSTTSQSIVVLRTSDGVASVRTGAATSVGAPPALPIAVDALAEWGFHLNDAGDEPRLAVAYERPKQYRTESPAPGVDVAVTSVAGYRATYVPGETNHVHLDPVSPEMIAYASGKDDFVYRDVTFDPQTMLPTHVVLTAPGETLTLDYAITNGAWLLAHVLDDDRTRTRAKAALRTLDATYDDVSTPPPPVAF